jgi:hypothetical protein
MLRTFSCDNMLSVRIKFNEDNSLKLRELPVGWCEEIWAIIIKDNDNSCEFLIVTSHCGKCFVYII